MIVKNTKENRSVANAIATMAIEKMYFTRSFVEELLDVANGKKTSEELRQKIIEKHRLN